jgi:hypothetical protein
VDAVAPIANLPWYDHPASAAALDDFWATMRDALRAAGVATAPASLTRTADLAAQWRSPGLVLGQCCTPDLDTPAGAALVPIARPVFADLDDAPGHYHSVVVAPPAGGPGTGRIAINAESSHSGHHALRAWMAQAGLAGGERVVTGAHARSLDLVARGLVDLAAIDAHTLGWLPRTDVRVVGRTASAPAPPWVRHRDAPIDDAVLVAALDAALERHGDALRLAGRIPVGSATP